MMGDRLIFKAKIFSILAALSALAACGGSKDPVLPGDRAPIFKSGDLKVLDKDPGDLGAALESEKCDYRIDGANMIWSGGERIFAGLPTESEIAVNKDVICRRNFIYAGLSTGELVKVNAKTRRMEWAADIFAARLPTGGYPFMDIIAAPIYNKGFVYAGGLGGAFCKVRDSDGKKIWCIPISVQSTICATEKFNVIRSASGETFVIDTGGRIYGGAEGEARAKTCLK